MDISKCRSESLNSPSEQPVVLQWKVPRLVRLGTLAALTSKVTNMGTVDGGTTGGQKRS